MPASKCRIALPTGALATLHADAAQVGTDIEPLAVKATASNAALNSVADRLDAYACAGAAAATFVPFSACCSQGLLWPSCAIKSAAGLPCK